ncbi:hypothetical protein GW17_00024243 [Ensete ventricosum]|nr:hypothetical protein GW17_00024243 [Ensete ventricosum]
MKKAVAARARYPKTSHPIVEPAAEKPMLVNVGPPVKKLKSPTLAPKSLGGRRAAERKRTGSLAHAPNFKLGLKKMRRVSYEFGYQIALTCFRTKHLGLEVKEDPYAILPEDDSVPMEVEVPFDNSDQPTM